MEKLEHLLEKNRAWAESLEQDRPGFFSGLAKGQAPDYLWIGCSDSRVPSGLLDLPPGEVFVHRNIANVVSPDDESCLAVIQYAVDVLKVRHIIVCGHTGCGGVKASLEGPLEGAIDTWLDNIRAVGVKHAGVLEDQEGQGKADLLSELNVREQCRNVCDNAIVRAARERGQELHVHGWIFDLGSGTLRDLEVE
ncbi:MAG: carbonic anhydrase [Lysobacterales bacterium]